MLLGVTSGARVLPGHLAGALPHLVQITAPLARTDNGIAMGLVFPLA